MGGFSLDDYVDVAERIQNFKDAHPKGSLQTIDWTVQTIGQQAFVVYRAAAYRGPDDERPGMGIAWEPFPGRTPYTKDSELMNAETAAWGRAIVALGLVANRKLASRQEVRNRKADQDAADLKAPAKATPQQRRKIFAVAKDAGLTDEQIREITQKYTGEASTKGLERNDVDRVLDDIKNFGTRQDSTGMSGSAGGTDDNGRGAAPSSVPAEDLAA